MKKKGVSRRKFVRLSALGAGAFTLNPFSWFKESDKVAPDLINELNHSGKMIFPRAFAFAIDDLGWNIGNDSGDIDGVGPYRIGIDRKMDITDYQGIVEVGQKVGTRIQCLFILSEMDRENILAKYPSTTFMGANWDNSKNVCDEQIDIMKYVEENAAHMEFGLHGVGHEYWVDGVKKRAEWYCQQDDHPWTQKSNEEHLQLFRNIMEQYGWSQENGQSFPESFVPCAYGYYWNPSGKYSTGAVMSKVGVKYVNTLFDYIRELNPPKGANGGGFDNGVIVINRINYGNPWYELASLPTVDITEHETDIIETHWSNWLAQDKFLQQGVNDRFVAYYQMVNEQPNRYVAKNTEQLHAQWLYNKYTKVTESVSGTVSIDNTKMPSQAYENNILGTMVLKIKLKKGEHISDAKLNGKSSAVYQEIAGYGLLYLPRLAQKKYELTYQIGNKKMPILLDYTGTFNVYSFEPSYKKSKLEVRVYGTQDLVIQGIRKPHAAKISNPNLKIVKTNYDKATKTYTLTLKARDMQGETAMIRLI